LKIGLQCIVHHPSDFWRPKLWEDCTDRDIKKYSKILERFIKVPQESEASDVPITTWIFSIEGDSGWVYYLCSNDGKYNERS